MALNNSQYDIIMRIYDQRQAKDRHLLEQRLEEVYAKIPRIRDIESEISAIAVSRARELLFSESETPHSRELSDKMKALISEKASLISMNGFPSDYMEMQYCCPTCKDTGYVNNKKCKCFRQAVIDMLYTQSNIKQVLEKENFSTFSLSYYDDKTINPITNLTPYQNMNKVYEICRQYVEEFGSAPKNLLFYGETGTGKTFMTNCIAKELIEKSHSVIYLTAISLFDMFAKQAFNNDSDDTVTSRELEQYLLDCDLLIIDDLGTESPNSFTNSKLFYCLNERHIREKSTIISTNLSLDMLDKLYSERISSRILSNFTVLKLYGDDIRMKKKLG